MKKIQLKPSGYALVDDDDFNNLSKKRWYLSAGGYAIGGEDSNGLKAYVKMHRVIMGAKNPKIHIDHIDGDKLNNQKDNLRFATPAQNTHNARKQKGTKNKYKGTNYVKSLNLWQARCRMNGEDHFLGHYRSEIAAAHAYNKKAIELSSYVRINHIPYTNKFLDNLLKRDLIETVAAKKVSKYRYIFFKKKSGRAKKDKWFICFFINGDRTYKGYFDSEKEALTHLIENYSNVLAKPKELRPAKKAKRFVGIA